MRKKEPLNKAYAEEEKVEEEDEEKEKSEEKVLRKGLDKTLVY